MDDVLIVGAGPAGAVAATVLARAGARVRLVDRAAFPRDKLCGDTVNPGTLAMLRRLGLAGRIEPRGLPIDGMIVTGEGGVAVEARYPAWPARPRDRPPRVRRRPAGAGDRGGRRVRAASRCATPSSTVRRRRRSCARRCRTGISMPRASSIAAEAGDRRSRSVCGSRGTRRRPGAGRSARTSTSDRLDVRRDARPPRRYIGVAPIPGRRQQRLPGDCRGRAATRPERRRGRCDFRDPPGCCFASDRRGARAASTGSAAARLDRHAVVLGPLAVDVRPRRHRRAAAGGRCRRIHRSDDRRRSALCRARRASSLRAAALEALAHGWAGVHARLAAASAPRVRRRSGASTGRCVRWWRRRPACAPLRPAPASLPASCAA